MKALWNYLFRDDFIKHSIIFFIGSGTISFINYIYHPVIGNLVSVADFGEIQVLYSFYNVFGIFILAFTGVIVHATTNIEDEKERALYVGRLGVLGVGLAILVAGAVALASPLLQKTFGFDHAWPFVVFAALLPFAAYVGFGTAFFQGQKKFGQYTIGNALVSVLKLLAALALIYIGSRVLGIMFGFLIAQVLGALYIFFRVRKKVVFSHRYELDENSRARLRRETAYALMVLIMNLGIVIFYTTDILFVKYLFSKDVAGLYSGVSTIAKIIFFATQPICGVLLATVRLKNTRHENNRLLLLGLLGTIVISGALWLIFSAYHDMIISTLLGEKFSELSAYLGPVSLIMALVGLYNVILTYLLALRRKYVFVPVLVSLALLCALASVDHNSIDEVIRSFRTSIITGLVLAILGLVREWVHLPKNNELKETR